MADQSLTGTVGNDQIALVTSANAAVLIISTVSPSSIIQTKQRLTSFMVLQQVKLEIAQVVQR